MSTPFHPEPPEITRYRRNLVNLLRSPPCQWISFGLGAVAVDRWLFQRAIEAIEGKPTGSPDRPVDGQRYREMKYGIDIIIDPDKPLLALGVARGQYDSDQDTLFVLNDRGFDTLAGRANLVHECVHAGLDVKGGSPRIDTECAGLLAEYLYQLNEAVGYTKPQQDDESKILRLKPHRKAQAEFFEVVQQIFLDGRKTVLSNQRAGRQLQRGSFATAIDESTRGRLHTELLNIGVYKVQGLAETDMTPGPRVKAFSTWVLQN
jgi:hypothetical protein